MFSGLSFLMKMRKENYVDELVRKERLVDQCKARKAGSDQPKTWRDDEYARQLSRTVSGSSFAEHSNPVQIMG